MTNYGWDLPPGVSDDDTGAGRDPECCESCIHAECPDRKEDCYRWKEYFEAKPVLLTSSTCTICKRVPESERVRRLDIDSVDGQVELAMLNVQSPALPILVLEDEVLMGEDVLLWEGWTQ